MERAGLAVADEAARLAKSRGRIVVLCGPGGNGGDGFIAARLLARRGYPVELGLIGRRDALSGDPALAASRYEGQVLDAAAIDPGGADCVIDALFGAGLARDIEGEAKAIIERINAFAARRRARARGRRPLRRRRRKRQGSRRRGRGERERHLLPPQAGPSAAAGAHALRGDPARRHRHPRSGARAHRARKPSSTRPPSGARRSRTPSAESHKYARGAVLVLSGAAHRTGAARLAARAALRSGAGIVTLASPPDAVAVNAAHLTAVMVAPFAGASDFEALLADERRRAIALGPGAGVGPALRKLVAAALTRPAERRTIVLDADALTSFAGDAARLAALIARGGHSAVMTPHEGEFARLFEGAPDVRLEDDKLTRARAAARLMGAVVLIKGADTVVAAPDGRATIGWDLPPTARHRRLRRRAGGPCLRPRRAGHAAVRSRLRRRLAARRLRPRARPRPHRRGLARGAAGGAERPDRRSRYVNWRWERENISQAGC